MLPHLPARAPQDRLSWRRISTPLAISLGAAAICLLTAIYLALALQDARTLRQANQLGLEGRYADAAKTAGEVRRRPAHTEALLVRATALARQGRLLAASGAFAEAAGAAPNSWRVHRDWAILEARLARRAPPRFKRFRRARARRQMELALRLNPMMRLPSGFRYAAGRR